MTNRDAEFVRKFLTAVFGDANKDAILRSIEVDVDIDMVNAINSWMKTQADAEPIKLGKVMASVAYWLAFEISQESDTESDACLLSQFYADYLHQATHVIYRGEKAKRDAAKSKK